LRKTTLNDGEAMKLLLISFWFPPTNAIGAVRVGKFAKYLHQAGHDIRVLAGPEIDSLTLPLELPAGLVVRPANAEVSGAPPAQPSRALRLMRRIGALGTASEAGGLESALKRQYRALRHIPDKRIGWLRPAVAAGRRLLQTWHPDLIIASAPPFTGFLVARKLARESAVPWIAELRDPWADNPYGTDGTHDPAWRCHLDRIMEQRTLRSAAALVTVSPPVTRELQQRYRQPIATVLNGYSEEDLVTTPPRLPSGQLAIVYTGTIYAGLRDPSALFAAIARLGARRNAVDVIFHGPTDGEVRHLAERHGVQDRVFVQPRLAYRASLERQAAADVLLLLQRNHVTDEGNIPAKFFEYLAARRPILLLGCETGIIAGMIRDRQAGFVSNDPAAIATALARWLDQLPHAIPPLAAAARQGLSRTEQFVGYEAFLRKQVPG
jgi:glycosyltransferase involved in cell wall biosynthesis